MAVADLVEEFCESGKCQRNANLFNLYPGIKFRLRAFHVPVLAVNTKSYRLPKTIVIAALLLNFTVASCVLLEEPQNEAVVVGNDPVKFKCKSDQPYRLKWWTQQSPSRQILFNGYSVSEESKSFCSVENEASGEFYLNLAIKNEAAQTYICHEPGTNKESSADLIIIERKAKCETDANNSHVIITCDIEFCGNWAPELEWRYNGTLITEGVNASIVSNKSVSSTLTVPLGVNARNYTCTTRFDIRGKPHWTTSNNIPDYVSHSVQTVKANQAIAGNHEAQLSASGTSVGLVIGIISLAIAVFAVIIVFILLMKRKKGCRNVEAADVGVPLAA